MKKILLLILTVSLLASCSFETSMCAAYGQSKKITKSGNRAQLHYIKRKF